MSPGLQNTKKLGLSNWSQRSDITFLNWFSSHAHTAMSVAKVRIGYTVYNPRQTATHRQMPRRYLNTYVRFTVSITISTNQADQWTLHTSGQQLPWWGLLKYSPTCKSNSCHNTLHMKSPPWNPKTHLRTKIKTGLCFLDYGRTFRSLAISRK